VVAAALEASRAQLTEADLSDIIAGQEVRNLYASCSYKGEGVECLTLFNLPQSVLHGFQKSQMAKAAHKPQHAHLKT
jgi:hypothetical protein